MDQLDEISRRDFLKGAGVGAVAGAMGAAGYNAMHTSPKSPTELPPNPQIYYLVSYLGWFRYGGATTQEQKYAEQLLDQAYINVKSLPDNETIALQKALQKGRDDAIERKKSIIALIGDKDFGKVEAYMAKEAQPYYQKLQTLLKSTNEEMDEAASPDAVRRIEHLIRY